ncbi:trypsin-like serine protease [uncultured Enterovirga sp.]|uniref:S1 family peptidase n=1 Tax=uncultured Enterovirga sp. TaxID=2026352 RepID=UPI0035CC3778
MTRGVVTQDPNGLRRSVVQIESSRGELCSGAVIAPDLILTAAHCVLQRAAYRVVLVDQRFRRFAVKAVAAAMHPDFVPGTTPRNQPGIDLAIIKLARPLGPDFTPLDPAAASSVAPGDFVNLAGFGLSAENRRGSARVLRQTRLISLGTLQVRNRVLVMADEDRLAETTGAGACRGDSGGPIVRGGPGSYQLLGIVSWSSGALKSNIPTACGGLTAVTPVAEHEGWIASRSDALRRYSAERGSSSAGGNAYDWTAR